MPWANEKSEIMRQVAELLARRKIGTCPASPEEDFAVVEVGGPGSAASGDDPVRSMPVPPPPADEKRERFLEMRRLAEGIYTVGYTGGLRDRLQAVLFYKQARFMESFEDDYDGDAPFSMYFPDYQSMSYGQLRTYFTWRGGVRRGVVRRTSFSYVFLYIYELINNVGVKDGADGFGKLAFIWGEYRAYEKKLDRYMNEWIRDYYVTNDFSEPFKTLLQKSGDLEKLYTPPVPGNFFDFYVPYSDYKIQKSVFYTPETAPSLRACFNHVIGALDEFLGGRGREFEDLIFYSKSNAWTPFPKALYCSLSRPASGSRAVKLSDTETYRCENGRWSSSTQKIRKENGRPILGYLFRRIERFYRRASGFPYRLTADPGKIAAEVALTVPDTGSFFARIDAAIADFYRESRRKTVTVDAAKVEAVRAGAQRIQERLLADGGEDARPDEEPETRRFSAAAAGIPTEAPDSPAAAAAVSRIFAAPADGWSALARSFTETEAAAVRMLLRGAAAGELQRFSKSGGVMLEVLIDGINQKAIDAVSDDIVEFSDEIAVVDEYKEDLKRVMSVE